MHDRRPRSRYWTAAVTYRGEERRAAAHVERQGFRHFLPELRVHGPVKELNYRRLLFPGYIFIHIKPNWEPLLIFAKGIYQFIMTNCVPVPIPQSEINYLANLQDEHGLINRLSRFQIGQQVKVGLRPGKTHSYMVGRQGTVQSFDRSRCAVLFNILGRDVRKVFDERLLEAA